MGARAPRGTPREQLTPRTSEASGVSVDVLDSGYMNCRSVYCFLFSRLRFT